MFSATSLIIVVVAIVVVAAARWAWRELGELEKQRKAR